MVAEESADDLQGGQNAPLLDRVTSLVNKVILRADSEKEKPEDRSMVRPCSTSRGRHRPRQQDRPVQIGKYWILDPIDVASKGFINKRQYAIALALMDDGEIVGGVLGALETCRWSRYRRAAPRSEAEPPGVVFLV